MGQRVHKTATTGEGVSRMFIWIVEEYNELGSCEWSWEFVDAGLTEADANKIIELNAGDKTKDWQEQFMRKKMVLLKDFSKLQEAN